MRRVRQISLAAAFLISAAAGYAQEPATNPGSATPNFKVQIWGDIAADFSVRIERYLELRRTLEEGLPPLALTDDPADIGRAEHALAERIRVARAGAKRGDIFTPDIRADFRRVLLLEVDSETRIAIMDDNPGAFSSRINGTYSKDRALSTVPGNILAALPRLPDDIQYRFLGPDLILHDTRANVILDRLRCAIRCGD
jgi:hypothetical protein